MRRFRVLVLALPVAGIALLAPIAARAQMDSREGIALQNQILELRRDLQMLQERGFSGGDGGPPPIGRNNGGGNGDLVAGLVARVQAMEEEVRRLRGRVDEIDNRSQRQYADLNKQLGDLNFRLGNQATAPAVAPPPPRQVTAAEPPPVPAAPAASGIPRTPERALAEGNAALARRDYAAAEAAAREALANRISPRGYDAQFLLAEALAGKHDWAQAAVAYNDSYTRLKTGSHAQDALLGLANAMLAIGEKRSACEAVAKLGFEFPNMRPDVRGGAGALKQRAQCS